MAKTCWLCGWSATRGMAYGPVKFLGHIVHPTCLDRHLAGKAALQKILAEIAAGSTGREV